MLCMPWSPWRWRRCERNDSQSHEALTCWTLCVKCSARARWPNPAPHSGGDYCCCSALQRHLVAASRTRWTTCHARWSWTATCSWRQSRKWWAPRMSSRIASVSYASWVLCYREDDDVTLRELLDTIPAGFFNESHRLTSAHSDDTPSS